MALATQESIRDRVYSLLESLTPSALSTPKFIRYRNEGGADFQAWAEANLQGCLRRVQVRQTGDDEAPEVSNTDHEQVMLEITATIAYPANHRYGPGNAMDRDDVMNADWKLIKHNLCGTGGLARSNFSTGSNGSYDCTPLPALMSTERGAKVDFLVIRLRFLYKRSTT